MHPEVEALILEKGWKPSQAALFEDIKRAFPDMSLNDAVQLVLHYYYPQKENRNGAIIEHHLTDVRTGKERVLTLEEMRKARTIVHKYKLGNIEYQYDAEDRLFDKAVDAKVKQILDEKLKEQRLEFEEMLKTTIADVRDYHHIQAARTARREFWMNYNQSFINNKRAAEKHGKHYYGKDVAIFHENLNPNKIASAIIEIDRTGIPERHFCLILYTVFHSLSGCLIITSKTKFIDWVKYNCKIYFESNDLKKIVLNDNEKSKVEEYKAIFADKQIGGRWIFNRRFYRMDSQGYPLQDIEKRK